MAEHVFTDDEIRQIIDVINRTKHTQYIGARYVPIFGRVNEDSIEWDNNAPYEPLTIVLYQGNSYTSRQHVPEGVEITDEQYWANTGNYNAQIEQYRQDVRAFDQRITNAQTDATTAINKATANEGNIATNTNDISENAAAAASAQSTADSAKEAADAAQSTADTAVSANRRLKLDLNDTRYGKGTHAVFIGDSITEGWNGSSSAAGGFVTPLCQHYGWTKHNYAVGGAGFNPSNSNNFKAQAERAAADSSYNHDEVSHVFVSGGINDGVPTGGDLDIYARNARDTVTTLRTAFPSARIAVVVGLCAGMDGRKHSNAEAPINQKIPYFTVLERALDDIGVTVVHGWRWLLTNPSYNDDGLHPNNAGYNILMGMYCGLVEGLPLNPCVADALPAYNIVTQSRTPLSNQSAIIYGVDTAHLFGKVRYTHTTADTAPDGDAIAEHNVSLIIGYLPPHMRSTFGTYFPVVVNINNITDWGYIEVQPATDKKELTALRLHYSRSDYNMSENNWTLDTFLSHTLPIDGVRS